MEKLLPLLWRIPEWGHRWVDGRGSNGEQGRWLIWVPSPPDSIGGLPAMPAWNPLEAAPMLYRTFADLETSEEAVLWFADQFGSLTEGEKVDLGDGVSVNGESWELWEQEIRDMRTVLALWEASHQPDLKRLQHLLQDQPPVGLEVRSVGGDHAFYPVHEPNSEAMVARQVSTLRDAVWSARMYVQTTVNSHLKEAVAPVVIQDYRTLEFRSRFKVKDLCGSLWAQIWRDLEPGMDPRRCPVCREWFVIRRDKDSRGNRQFCSNKCRTAAYKKRRDVKRQEALRLSSEGEKPAVVARKVGVKAKVIHEWLAQEKQRPGARRAKQK